MKHHLNCRMLALVAIALFTTSSLSPAQDIKKPQAWLGTLDAGVAKLRLRFEISPDEKGKLSCVMISLDQGGVKTPMDSCEIQSGRLIIKSTRLLITFDGPYKDASTEIAGKFKQAGQSFDLLLKPATPEAPAKPIENWTGTMMAGGRTFKFQFRVLETPDKKRKVELDSLSENISGLGVEATWKKEGVLFEIPVTKAKFEGKYNEDRTQLDGHWLQSGGKFPLVLKKKPVSETKTPEPPKRPQNPKEPLSYKSEEVQFQNPTAQISLSGTLTTPEGEKAHGAAILISGSGPQDRDEAIMGHKPFLVLADHLTRAGIAVLRYDERGVGESTGQYAGATSADFASDAEAAMEFLKSRSDIPRNRIGLIGHSEGGLVAPMIAARRNDVAFVVMLAGPGVTGEEIIQNQTELISRKQGIPEADMKLARRLQTVMFEAVRDADADGVEELMNDRIDSFLDSLSEQERENEIATNARVAASTMTAPWFVYFLKYDPRPALSKVKCPVLVLNGDKDLQVDPDLNLPEIRKALTAGNNTKFQIHKLQNLNHLFQNCSTGLPGEYRQIEETFAPDALELISNWISEL